MILSIITTEISTFVVTIIYAKQINLNVPFDRANFIRYLCM